jgi:hypothetical protein
MTLAKPKSDVPRWITTAAIALLLPKLASGVWLFAAWGLLSSGERYLTQLNLEKLCRAEYAVGALAWAPIFESFVVAILAFMFREMRLWPSVGACIIAVTSGFLHAQQMGFVETAFSVWAFWFFGYIMMRANEFGWGKSFFVIVALHFIANALTVTSGCIIANLKF